MLLVDEKLVVGIVRTLEPVEHEHPHVTVLLHGDTKPKESNYYLKCFAEEKQREFDFFVRGEGKEQYNSY